MSFIDGLSSGLDTTAIINQLMQLERRPQQALQVRRDQEQAAKTELSELRSDLQSIRNLAADLRLGTGWDKVTATVSDETAATATAGTSAVTSSYSFQVTSLATAASQYSTAEFADLDTVVTGTSTVNDVIDAVNSQDLGYSAIAVNTGTGYRIQLTANETGAASAFTPDAGIFGATAFSVLSAGSDAELTIQGDTPFTVSSDTNTFESLLPGVTVTVKAVTTDPVTVTTEPDLEATSEAVSELVTKLNEFFTRVDDSTRNEPDSARTVLQGNREARRAANEIRRAFTESVDGNTLSSAGFVGIELTREGTLQFDAARFKELLASDATTLTSLFADRTGTGEPGILDRVVDSADAATSVGEGYLYTAGETMDLLIEDYQRQIEAFERRMEIREATLRRTYANLEVSLGGLQQQSQWLASQLGTLGGQAQ